jgi:hypothetical protein
MGSAIEGDCSAEVRVALLLNPATAVPLKFYMPSVQAAASTSGIEVNATPVHAKDEIEGVIAARGRAIKGAASL